MREQEMDFRAGDLLAKLSFLVTTFPAASLAEMESEFSCRKRMDGALQAGRESPRQP